MITIDVARAAWAAMESACRRAGHREVGGILLAEHVAHDRFVAREATVASVGSFARFVRSIEHAWRRIGSFFERTGHDYRRFNYLGEWHSHPQFELYPSGPDDASMFEILAAPGSNARFV